MPIRSEDVTAESADTLAEQLEREGLSGLPRQLEVRRDRGYPIGRSQAERRAWQIYIDNYDEIEVIPREKLDELQGKASDWTRQALDLYAAADTPGNSDDNVFRQLDTTSLGVRNDGLLGRRDVPEKVLNKVIQATVWVLQQPLTYRKHLQILAGRWIRVMDRNRATMTLFNHIWVQISGTAWKFALAQQTRDELLRAVFLAPVMYTDLRTLISGTATVSDASESGGGLCVSQGLTAAGMSEAVASPLPCLHDCEENLFCLDINTRVGSLRRALELCCVPVSAYGASQTDQPDWRVITQQWPNAMPIPALEKITDEFVRHLRLEHLRVRYVIIGFSVLRAPTEEHLYDFGQFVRILSLFDRNFGTMNVAWI